MRLKRTYKAVMTNGQPEHVFFTSFYCKTQSQIGRAISSHTFLRAVAIFFHVCDHIVSVVTYHINAISYLNSQKWVTGSSNAVLWVKIAEKMALNEGNWVPWPVSLMKLLKQSDKTNASGMKTMERIANPGFIFTTKKIWRLPGWKYAHKKKSEVKMSWWPSEIDY